MATGRKELRLGELKDEWDEYCLRNNVNPSAAIKQVIAHLLKTDKLKNAKPVQEPAPPGETETLVKHSPQMLIRFTPNERQAIEKRAVEVEGFASGNKWVVALVRTNLTNQPQFSDRELKILGESNYQLLAIGRNLNQIAHAINATKGKESKYSPEVVADVQATVKEHVKAVGDLLRASTFRWKVK